MKGTRFLAVFVVLVLLLGTGIGLTRAQGPQPQDSAPAVDVGSTFTYQGQLNKDGSPVDDTCQMRFSLWDDPDAGAQVGSTLDRPSVTVSGGLFTVADLDFGADAFTGAARWLAVSVKCTGDSSFIPLAPRQALTAVPYALSLAPGAAIVGSAAQGLHVETSLDGGFGLYGGASATTGAGYGVAGFSASPGGRGVFGVASATDGVNAGVWGETSSTAGLGVSGLAGATSGTTTGVLGLVLSSAGYGVTGVSPFVGVLGQSTATAGATSGVSGWSFSAEGYGVFGANGAASGAAVGIYGQTASSGDSAYGVYGYAPSTTGFAIGVHGKSESYIGVLGEVTNPAGYGLASIGDFFASGTKSALVRTQDYGWRLLYAMESPDVLFEDVGTAQLKNGEARVSIDPIFAQTVNLDEPYQIFVTAQGQEFVLLLVAAKDRDGFTVRGANLDGQPTDCAFDYRIVAKRLGYEDTRLQPAPWADSDPHLNPDKQAEPVRTLPMPDVVNVGQGGGFPIPGLLKDSRGGGFPIPGLLKDSRGGGQ